jgi:hypothetical protein
MTNKANHYIQAYRPDDNATLIRQVLSGFSKKIQALGLFNGSYRQTRRSYRQISSSDTIYPKVDSLASSRSALSCKRFLEQIDIQDCVQKSNDAEDIKKRLTAVKLLQDFTKDCADSK